MFKEIVTIWPFWKKNSVDSSYFVQPAPFTVFNGHFSIVGAIHAGLGYNQIRNFLSELNLPIMSKSCYQRHEKKVGKIFRDVAENEYLQKLQGFAF